MRRIPRTILGCLITLVLAASRSFALDLGVGAQEPSQLHSAPAEAAGVEKQVVELPLAEMFGGCWKGEVLKVDSMRTLNGWPPLGFWHPKSFTMCFERRGSGRWEVSYSSARLETAPSPYFQQVSQSLRVLSGGDEDSLVVESRIRFRDSWSVKDETMTIHLHAAPPDALRAQAMVLVEMNGAPWMEASWHTDFRRCEAPSQAR